MLLGYNKVPHVLANDGLIPSKRLKIQMNDYSSECPSHDCPIYIGLHGAFNKKSCYSLKYYFECAVPETWDSKTSQCKAGTCLNLV